MNLVFLLKPKKKKVIKKKTAKYTKTEKPQFLGAETKKQKWPNPQNRKSQRLPLNYRYTVFILNALRTSIALQHDGDTKLNRRWKPQNIRRTAATSLFNRINWKNTQPSDVSCSAKHFSVHDCISGEFFDPSCSSQGDFPSSVVQSSLT